MSVLTFACYFPAENPLFFTVKIELGSWVDELLEAIQVKLHSRGWTDITVDHLRLYKVTMFFFSSTHPIHPQQTDIPLEPKGNRKERVLQWLHVQPEDAQLDESKKLASVFSLGPGLSDDQLDIIVADGEGVFYSVFNSLLLLISCQFWSWSKAWATQTTLIREK